jgi:hypothetical protein
MMPLSMGSPALYPLAREREHSRTCLGYCRSYPVHVSGWAGTRGNVPRESFALNSTRLARAPGCSDEPGLGAQRHRELPARTLRPCAPGYTD